jgi:hypothetical protein
MPVDSLKFHLTQFNLHELKKKHHPFFKTSSLSLTGYREEGGEKI